MDEQGEIIALLDIKTCCDASAGAFARSIASYGYDLQAAFYQDGLRAKVGKALPFYYAAIEKDAPHAVALYRASDHLIEVGRQKVQAGLQLLSWCRTNDRWPAYQPSGEIEEIDLPRWAGFELED